MAEWLKVKEGAQYSHVSERTFRPWLKDGLRHVRLPSGTILLKTEWVDQYLESFAVKEDRVDQIVNETMKDFR